MWFMVKKLMHLELTKAKKLKIDPGVFQHQGLLFD